MDAETKAALIDKVKALAPEQARAKLSRRYLDALKSSLFQQCWVLVSVALLLESLQANLFVLVAMVGHWLIALVIAIRRPKEPTRWDLLFCEFGFVPVALVAAMLAPIVWLAVGENTLYERWSHKVLVPDLDSLFPVQVAAGVGVVAMMGWMAVDFVLDVFWRKKKKVKRAKGSLATVVTGVKERKSVTVTQEPKVVRKPKSSRERS
jgi:hypothetical protein